MRSVAKTKTELLNIEDRNLSDLFTETEERQFILYCRETRDAVRDSIVTDDKQFIKPLRKWLEQWADENAGKWCSMPLNYHLALYITSLDEDGRTQFFLSLLNGVREALKIKPNNGAEFLACKAEQLPVTSRAIACIQHPSKLVKETKSVWNTLNNLLAALAFALRYRDVVPEDFVLATLKRCGMLCALPYMEEKPPATERGGFGGIIGLYSLSNEETNVMVFAKVRVVMAATSLLSLLQRPENLYTFGSRSWRSGSYRELRNQHFVRFFSYLRVTTGDWIETERCCKSFSGRVVF